MSYASNVVSLPQSIDYHALLCQKILEHSAKVTVIGQGYVGLPLAVEFGRMGFTVTGLDVSTQRVQELNEGRSPTPDIADADLQMLRMQGRYTASDDFACLASSDVILICVPTPLRKSKDPDISYVLDSASSVIEHLRPGQLIILESTTYPGTTEELLLPMFEDTGHEAGKDFFLAFSPERIDPGNRDFKVKDIPKVTGGITSQCTELAAMFYGQIVKKVVQVSSPKVAELAKLYENVFRSVNIALANEFSLMCKQLGVSTREVIDAAASKPFGFMPFYPGPGIGGHCIPIDPAYLVWKMKFSNYQARFIPLAEEINQSMPAHVIHMMTDALNLRRICLNGARVLAIGVAYKRDVGDVRESPALHIIENLIGHGVNVDYVDPFVPAIEIAGRQLVAVEIGDDMLGNYDCVLILTDHSSIDYHAIVRSASLILDTRGATRGLPVRENQVLTL